MSGDDGGVPEIHFQPVDAIIIQAILVRHAITCRLSSVKDMRPLVCRMCVGFATRCMNKCADVRLYSTKCTFRIIRLSLTVPKQIFKKKNVVSSIL